MDFINPGDWQGKDECLKHSIQWQYVNYGRNHCLGCLRDACDKLNMKTVSKLFPTAKTPQNNNE